MSSYDVKSFFELFSVFATSGIPVVGGPVSTIVAALFAGHSSGEEEQKVWDTIENKVNVAIKNAQIHELSNKLQKSLNNLGDNIERLKNR